MSTWGGTWDTTDYTWDTAPSTRVWDGWNLSVSDTLLLVDSTAVKNDTKNISDTLILTDATVVKDSVKAIFSDTILLTDATVIKSFIKAVFSDTLTLTDATVIKDSVKAISDTFTLTDATVIKDSVKAISDTLILSDAIAVKGLVKAIFSDTIILTDTASRVVAYYRTLTEELVIRDREIRFSLSKPDTTDGGYRYAFSKHKICDRCGFSFPIDELTLQNGFWLDDACLDEEVIK